MSNHANLAPGSVVPESGKYKCEFCGAGGIADLMGQLLNQQNVGLSTAGLHAHAKQENIRFFQAGQRFTQCPACGPATGWTLLEEPAAAPAVSSHHGQVVSESAVCDICDTRVFRPNGYLLTTTQVISTPQYWRHYYKTHAAELRSMGVSSYDAFCRSPMVRTGCVTALANQQTPWMVCSRCISMFTVHEQTARGYADKWWDSGRTFAPPGNGPASVSRANLGDAMVMSSRLEATPRSIGNRTKKWWQFWK